MKEKQETEGVQMLLLEVRLSLPVNNLRTAQLLRRCCKSAHLCTSSDVVKRALSSPTMKQLKQHVQRGLAPERLERWRPFFPDYSDVQLTDAIHDIDEYLRIAWRVYREQHEKDLLPDDL
jgi:hypothetical protein